ncbi:MULTISPECIES: hypothetical protein [Acinetobacter]|uniref:HEAT repeat domain-containing protein n=14 Tax=Acinetobacter baumannii TaxID=470 RepID=A0A0D5YGZ1_ACIBA|nr:MULTISPECIES: hypothetical protein [Acinetobacter]EMT97536.1 hypothetical protein ABNIH6_03895 [Acinetobacter baumannii ABNIH6]EMU06879.1 hypothetical protein ABNIH10_11725 [Acinetobacter baumannii ABNIH10]PXA50751.1 hypothetical protein DMB35_13035 [Acinetobacter baumannii A424]SSW86750.1 Uncharacterised protein [Klebsiella pneumoniae]ACJ42671.1 hypothetical protein AB57_2563 [Acinetobacter baumannii AB0057]
MNDFETNIECCYLGVIPVKILKERLNFKDISDYLFAKELLKIAENLRNSDAVHLAFLIFDDYILQEEDFGLLDIFFSDWHDAHEDIVFTVSRIRNCNLVEFFKKAINFIPSYMVEDDSNAIARKAFFGLGTNINCSKSLEYLNNYANSSDIVLKKFAIEQLELLS